ncbi:homoserine dehydrogenase [Iamia majanohamensis]|uniref:Homoserine dehydrogenase n=1 Tax=Iamia majanohamensis TaxID=467976 RepID=A0AAF0BS55_9ACTN|nr:homoserine dehydrogenase [Iamia majanohamensis]WCO67746.1 homoserine dehydrogenase [Iamia majanohamensis]
MAEPADPPAAADVPVVRVGLLGCGNVGAALVGLVERRAAAIAGRSGVRLEVSRIAVRSLTRDRGVEVADGVLTRDAAAVAVDPEVDLVVEVIGGIEPARELTLAALAAGKPVVSANKELLANHGGELATAAEAAGVDLLFEAAVAGGIPIIRPLRESLAGEDIDRVMGIVNGTTNFILTRMTEEGADYADALAEAQGLGYAERDPTADVEGYDAGAKAAIIASLAFGQRVVAGDVYHEGIAGLTAADIDSATRLGHVIKLLAVCERVDGPDGPEVAVRVHPAMVPLQHPLAGVRDSFNAVFVEGAAVGDLMFYGRGAGGDPTASAVLGDVVDAAVNLRKGTFATVGIEGRARIRAIDEQRSPFYVSIDVEDRPGVLRSIAEVFERNQVSIRSLEQDGAGSDARIVLITHTAREADLQATVSELRDLPAVHRVGSVVRVVGDEG